MKLLKEYGDLFELENEYILAHCISSDFELGLGIAKEFDKRYKMKRKLMGTYTVNGKVPRCLKIDNVYNLVTKAKYWQKPTYITLRGSLEMLRDQMLENREVKLAIPLIGCGLDKLQWGKVEEIINEVFNETEIEIRVRLKK